MPIKSSSRFSIEFALLCIFSIAGLSDSLYLAYEKWSGFIPPCSTAWYSDCGKVLTSSYSELFGIPLFVFGAIHYFILFSTLIAAFIFGTRVFWRYVFLATLTGALFSIYLVTIQLFVLHAICLYCMGSALSSFLLYSIARILFPKKYLEYRLWAMHFCYKLIAKPLFFTLNPEFVHTRVMQTSMRIRSISFIPQFIQWFFGNKDSRLSQKIGNVTFPSPVGLAAGYDYEAAFPGVLYAFNFGFQTVGTITNQPCEGNAKPRLGRLPKSRSLLVNKGFRNPGVKKILHRLSRIDSRIPVGVSIGVTNSKEITSVEKGIEDILNSFKECEKNGTNIAYYELNISCPNLAVPFTFYDRTILHTLLEQIQALHIAHILFIKMPIEKSDEEFLEIVRIISQFDFVTGVIIGNLQKNRKDLSFDPEEISKAGKGNFSGKPCYERSNQLIRLTSQNYKDRFVIVGCGGIFSVRDAIEKMQAGASLLQLITGMIYEGPQLPAQIAYGLSEYLTTHKLNSIEKLKSYEKRVMIKT